VASEKSEIKDDLKRVLDEINSSLGDFSERPAKLATDIAVSGDTPLHKIAIWGDVASAEVLLSNGADVNAHGEDQDTPLHRAIAGEHLDMIRFLLANGARHDLPNRYGTSPLVEAENSGNPSFVAAFRLKSADPR
jgi:ankyrin repeat protein